MTPRFIDLLPNSPGGPMGWIYECTNEDLPTLRKLTSIATRGGWFVRKGKKVGSISSGGEVPLTVLLPTVKSELVAVDHSLGSLAWAMFKVYLLQKFPTTAEFKKWLKDTNEAEFTGTLDECVKTLPAPLNDPANLGMWFKYRMADNLNMICKQWTETPDKLIDKARERLDLLTFVHGDLTDIAQYGPFDLLYISNALAHTSSKTDAELDGNAVKPLLTQRGKVIVTHDPIGQIAPQIDKLPDWPSLKYVKLTNATTRWQNIEWHYNLRQKPAEPKHG